jgi:hypothetical protein
MRWTKLALMSCASLALTAACGGDDSGPGMGMGDGGTKLTGESHGYVVASLDVARQTENEELRGFNLDGLDSDGDRNTTEDAPCQPEHLDFTAPDGDTGVDNQFAVLAPDLEDTAGFDIKMSAQDAINSGDLLLLLEVEGVNEFGNDDSVRLNFYLGYMGEMEMPALSDGTLEAGQTIDVNSMPGVPIVSINGQISNGTLMAGQLVDADATVPLSIPFDEETTIDITIRNAAVEGSISAEAMTDGVIGGSLRKEELIETIQSIPQAQEFASLAEQLLNANADVESDSEGSCQSLSVGLVFEAVDATLGEEVTPGGSGGGEGDAGTGSGS